MPYCETIPPNLSFWNLFLGADWIVKSVILGLIFASIWSWSIMFSKWMTLKSLQKSSRRLREAPIHLETWKEADPHWGEKDPFTQLVDLAARELQRHPRPASKSKEKDALVQRIEQLMSIRIEQKREDLATSMGVLASVGSTSPFVGLFGTVWGIMNSFQCIAGSKSTSLAVVAPGIAEALFATAIGLVVAIPAVIAYNRLTLAINSYIVSMENFAQELSIKCSMESGS